MGDDKEEYGTKDKSIITKKHIIPHRTPKVGDEQAPFLW